MAEVTYPLTGLQLDALLDYVTHRPDCEAVVHRLDPSPVCTCGLTRALRPLLDAEIGVPSVERLLSNRNVFAGRTVPGWLRELVTAEYRRVSHRGRYQPSEMSDG